MQNHAPLPPGARRAILALPPTPNQQGRDILFTAQQLFGELGTSADVLTHAPFLEHARRERERDRDRPARLALGAYVVARLVDRLLALRDQPETNDGFLWQLEAVRRHMRDLPADAPETAHLTGITDAVPADGGEGPGLRLTLTAYAYFLEHEARLEEALEMLGLAARTHGSAMPPAEFAATALFAGRLNRLLARWNAANGCYAAAEAAARVVGDQVTVLRSRLGRVGVMRGQGNLPLARASVETVIQEAGELGLREVQAMACADLGSVCANQGLWVEAVQANYQAFGYSEDSLQRMRVLGDLGVCLREIGAYDSARLAFEIVVGSNTSFLVRTNAVLELMDLESTVRNQVAFERRRAQAEDARDRMTPSMAAEFHHKAGIGLARFGRFSRARALLAAGMKLAEAHQLNAWYFRLERVLAGLDDCQAHEPDLTAPAAGLGNAPAVLEVAVGLREYAQLAD
jgi:tetratricopeptide (TPR) repeat protein